MLNVSKRFSLHLMKCLKFLFISKSNFNFLTSPGLNSMLKLRSESIQNPESNNLDLRLLDNMISGSNPHHTQTVTFRGHKLECSADTSL